MPNQKQYRLLMPALYRKLNRQKMDSDVTKRELRVLLSRLGALLNQRKALNSKVTSRHFERFRDATDGGGDVLDVKQRLNQLEQALKQEGLFKNVKSDFIVIKKDILNALYADDKPKQALPGIHGAAKDKTFYVSPKASDNDTTPAPGTASTRSSGTMSTDDMRILNTAIGKLYRHLQISAQKDTDTPRSVETLNARDEAAQKENVNILSINHQDDSFHEIVLKIRNFEKEFQRQKVQQHREIIRLQEETKQLTKKVSELKKENERFKGIQPIVSKAKGKQVEKIEERHRTEKKGIEEKLNELEEGMKKNLERAMHDRDEMKHQMRGGFETLVSSINNLHYMVHGPDDEQERRTNIALSWREESDLPMKVLSESMTSIVGGVQVLKTRNQELNSKVNDMTTWRKCLKDLERDVSTFCRSYGDVDSSQDRKYREGTTTIQDLDPYDIKSSCTSKLQKTKEIINAKLRNISDTNTLVKRKEKDIHKIKQNMEELSSEIHKLHDTAMTAQLQDISIPMPSFEHRSGSERGYDSVDDLPEAEREEQLDLIDRLRQTGTMIQHFQKVITERTNTMNKMENDLLPLKIRVTRLHDDISRGMQGMGDESPSPEDGYRNFREKSPVGSHVFSKEINGMLTKLSKMELSIRHLLEQQGGVR